MISGRAVTGSFSSYLLNFIGPNERLVQKVYSDKFGVPTIGYGYALVVRGTGGWAVPNYISTDFSGIHTFTTSEKTLLTKIAGDLNRNDQATAKSDLTNGLPLLSFTISPQQAITLFQDIADRNLKLGGGDRLKSANASLIGSHELVSLYDLSYQAPALLTSELKSAISSGDRQQAWYIMLTGLNGNKDAALEARRMRDATEFGLYNNGNTPATNDQGQEAIQVYRFLDKNNAGLVAAFTADHVTSASSKAYIEKSYAPARTQLITTFGGGNTTLKNVIVAGTDASNSLTIPTGKSGATLLVTGTGSDNIVDLSTGSLNNIINVRSKTATVAGDKNADLSDILIFGGSSIKGTIQLDKAGHATDGNGRTYSYTENSHAMVITDRQGDKLTITSFQDGDFGLSRTLPLSHVIRFDEFATGSTITNQYQSVGVKFASSVFISSDGANPTSPVLSGSPRFEGPISATFVDPKTGNAQSVKHVEFDAGYFNDLLSTKVTFYDQQGKVLGSETNSALSIEHFSFTSDAGIARFTIQEVGQEDAGFAIDNLGYTTMNGAKIESNDYPANHVLLQQMNGNSLLDFHTSNGALIG